MKSTSYEVFDTKVLRTWDVLCDFAGKAMILVVTRGKGVCWKKKHVVAVKIECYRRKE